MKSSFRNAIRLLIAAGLSISVHAAEVPATDPGSADAGSARAALAQRLQSISSFAARFTQEIQGAHGQVLERSTGEIRLLRPSFRWEVDAPFPQIIVTEGDELKVYDPDLEQLTIRPLEDALEDTPVSLLTRDDVVLGDRFVVTYAEADAFVIVPSGSDALYAEIRLVFAEFGLAELSILDHLGQYTRVRFEEAPPGTVIHSDDFRLDVPPGTDVIGG